MMREVVSRAITEAVKGEFQLEVTPELSYPQSEHGDVATNVAFQLAGQLKRSPQEIATQLATAISAPEITKTVVAGGGFINIFFTENYLFNQLSSLLPIQFSLWQQGKTVVAEYSDPNPFKELHAGHLYTSIVGDAIANLYEVAGAKVARVNFGGDVGLHVGKAMYGINKLLDDGDTKTHQLDKLQKITEAERPNWLAKAYVIGSKAYEEDESAKAVIQGFNEDIYRKVTEEDHQSNLAQIYWTCRQWSYDYFNAFYARLGSYFDKYYPESVTAPLGLKAVKKQLSKGVFKESEGAVIFDGESHGLHRRVFITSAGLPTYETKDVGLALAKWADYHFDTAVIITGNDITEYMKVVLAALAQFEPEIAARTLHIPHGMIKLAGQGKMSSREGNVLRAVDVLEAAAAANAATNNSGDDAVSLGAVKYSFLKQQIGPDIVFNPAESVKIEGNSGPYLQYAHVRAASILGKLTDAKADGEPTFNAEERRLALGVLRFTEVVEAAGRSQAPHQLAGYLYELAQAFSAFYQQHQVIDGENSGVRAVLVTATAAILAAGLKLLNIQAPNKM